MLFLKEAFPTILSPETFSIYCRSSLKRAPKQRFVKNPKKQIRSAYLHRRTVEKWKKVIDSSSMNLNLVNQ